MLLHDWDPIGVQEISEAQDEFDSYVGGVYRLLSRGATEEEIVDHLQHIERVTMGLPARDRSALFPVAQGLIRLDVALGRPD